MFQPLFGARADRISPRPALFGGLIGFALASAAVVVAAGAMVAGR